MSDEDTCSISAGELIKKLSQIPPDTDVLIRSAMSPKYFVTPTLSYLGDFHLLTMDDALEAVGEMEASQEPIYKECTSCLCYSEKTEAIVLFHHSLELETPRSERMCTCP